jgi:signal transduction histidine kinase
VKLTCFLIPGKEAPLGFLGLGLKDDVCVTDQDLALLGSLGNFLGGAIENSLLHQQVRQRSKELRKLTARLFHTQEVERKRIARELHDEAGQALTGINLMLDAIDKKLPDEAANLRDIIADIKKQVTHTYQGMRRLSHKLHPAILNDLGLKAALDADISIVKKHSNIHVEYRVIGFERNIDPELAIALYRLSQEAFTNTLKHAKAKHFKLSIIKSFPRIIFVAEDDGEGFEPSDINWLAGSLGLVSMRERAAIMGGSFTLRSSKGHGTQIRIEIPVKESRDED